MVNNVTKQKRTTRIKLKSSYRFKNMAKCINHDVRNGINILSTNIF